MFQEIDNYNRLIDKIKSSLLDLIKAMDGEILMSAESDEILGSLNLNKLPFAFEKICYPSHKPLSSWFDDLKQRIIFIRSWMQNGNPATFWLSGLFFPQGFITGLLQNHARVTKTPVSDISFRFSIVDKEVSSIEKAPSVFA